MRRLELLAVAATLLALGSTARADSVAQIATGVRISRGTATLIDPQGRPGVMSDASDTAARPGDVLTFVAHFTPVPNGGVRGLGGYVTVYVPRNTEVVGVRFVDSEGRTVPPHRGGLASEGTGPRGSVTLGGGREGGSMSQLYADTGIFYATDPLTERRPDGRVAAETFLTIFNGIELDPRPTAFGQLAPILGADTAFAHNRWDVIQAYAFGVGGAALGTGGRGNTPDRYGSAVAGPQSFYLYEASYGGDVDMPITVAGITETDTVGPWNRIRTLGAEIGRRGVAPPVPSPGPVTRIGVPALEADGTPMGALVHGGAALPAFDDGAPADPYVRALRFAVGELVVGEEYLSEFSLRVLDLPLDPVSGSDTVCAEVFGGDASAEEDDGSKDGKDNTWRYFLPAPACVSLGLLFDIDVSALVALVGDTLTYTISGKNLATFTHHDVVVRYCYEAGEVDFVSASEGGVRGDGTGCPDPGGQDDVSWSVAELEPGAELEHTVEMRARGGGRGESTIGRAIFTSTELPAPGFSTVAFTNVQELTIIDLDLTATPDEVATPPGTVRYTATVHNAGTGLADLTCGADCRVVITLPEGFGYVAASTEVGGAAAADPGVAGRALTFTDGLVDLAPGDTMTIAFDATVPADHPTGVYPSDIETWLDDSGAGERVNDAEAGLAPVAVGAPRSDVPTLSEPLLAGAARVCGSSTEAAGTVVRIFVAGVEIAEATTAADGTFCADVPAAIAGQAVSATAQAAGELESARSDEVLVSVAAGVTACSDGIDNDGDGLIDFPDDPDCESAEDPEEAPVPACSDGVDNDGDGLTDFGEDPGCSSLVDDDESGGAECADGIDNDGDGDVDFPDDEDCESADDRSERHVPACANGEDDDGDGAADFPLDDGCESALDDDERAGEVGDAGAPAGDAGSSGDDAGPRADGGAGGADAGAGGADSGPGPSDPGGVDAPDTGCGCRASGDGHRGSALALLVLFGWLARRREG